MNRGHVTGTKVEKHGATNWYAEIEAARISRPQKTPSVH